MACAQAHRVANHLTSPDSCAQEPCREQSLLQAFSPHVAAECRMVTWVTPFLTSHVSVKTLKTSDSNGGFQTLHSGFRRDLAVEGRFGIGAAFVCSSTVSFDGDDQHRPQLCCRCSCQNRLLSLGPTVV